MYIHREVAKVIMDGPDWRRSLRTSNVIDRVANTPFRRMIKKMPGILVCLINVPSIYSSLGIQVLCTLYVCLSGLSVSF